MSNKQMMEFSIQIIVIRFQATAISYGGFRHNFNERVRFGEGNDFLRYSLLPHKHPQPWPCVRAHTFTHVAYTPIQSHRLLLNIQLI